MSAETIIYNAKIATNASPSFVEAIAIEGGNVSATGNSDEMLRFWPIQRPRSLTQRGGR